MVETPGIEPGSGQETNRTSTCLAERFYLTVIRQFGKPLDGESGFKSDLLCPDYKANRPIFDDAHLLT